MRQSASARSVAACDSLRACAAITGHSLDATRKILEVYMPRTTKMAGKAIALRMERSAPADAARAAGKAKSGPAEG